MYLNLDKDLYRFKAGEMAQWLRTGLAEVLGSSLSTHIVWLRQLPIKLFVCDSSSRGSNLALVGTGAQTHVPTHRCN